MSYFSPRQRGGVVAANIEHQDVVAVFVALDLALRQGAFRDIPYPSDDWIISLETLDDIVVHLPNIMRCYVQVKAQTINQTLLKDLITAFESKAIEVRDVLKDVRFLLFALDGVVGPLSALPKKLDELRAARTTLTQEEFVRARQDLAEGYAIPQNIVEGLFIETRSLKRDLPDTLALFAHELRRLFPIVSFGDLTVEVVYLNVINNLIAPRRRQRLSFTRTEFLKACEGHSDAVTFLETLYKKMPTGYKYRPYDVPESAIMRARAQKQFMKEWRKAYFATAMRNVLRFWLAPLLRPIPDCEECWHPLVFGFGGLSGIRCRRCGWFPFATLVVFCKCGAYTIVKRQPPTNAQQILELLSSHILEKGNKCQSCGQPIPLQHLRELCAIVPFPLPADRFVELGFEKYRERYCSSELPRERSA
jgi:hypothetical protein